MMKERRDEKWGKVAKNARKIFRLLQAHATSSCKARKHPMELPSKAVEKKQTS